MQGLEEYRHEEKERKDQPFVNLLFTVFPSIPLKEHDLITQPEGGKFPATVDASDSSLHQEKNGSVEYQTWTSDDEESAKLRAYASYPSLLRALPLINTRLTRLRVLSIINTRLRTCELYPSLIRALSCAVLLQLKVKCVSSN